MTISLFEKLTNGIDENFTTDILWYLLRESQPIRKVFLRLLGSNSSDSNDFNISTQEYILKEDGSRGYVDLVLKNVDKSLIYVENKPWDGSTPTSSTESEGDQIHCYKQALAKNHHQEKILCLLCTDSNRYDILEKTWKAAKYTDIGSLIQKYQKDGIRFIDISWNDLIAKIDEILELDPFHFGLVQELRGYLFPKRTGDNFDSIDIAKEAHDIFLNTHNDVLKLDYKGGRKKGDITGYKAVPLGAFQWGYFPNYEDALNQSGSSFDNPFFFNICIMNPNHSAWRRYGMDDEFLARNRTPLFRRDDSLTFEFLTNECGFTYLSGPASDDYFKQLKLGKEEVNNPKKIADAAFDILVELQNKIREHFEF